VDKNNYFVDAGYHLVEKTKIYKLFICKYRIFVFKKSVMIKRNTINKRAAVTSKIILYLILLFECKSIISQPLVTSEYNHRHYGIPDGLPTEVVECAFQDSRGFLWFGTEHGATCFDGHTFKTYLSNKSLPINKIEENERGEIIFYGYHYIYLLNVKIDSLRRVFKDDNLNYCVDKSPGLPKEYSLYIKRNTKQPALFHFEKDTLIECFSHPLLAEMAFGQSIYYDTEAQLFYIPTQDKQIHVVSADGKEQNKFDNILVNRFLKYNGELLAIGFEGVWTLTPSKITPRLKFPKAIDAPAINSDEDIFTAIDADGNLIIRDNKSVHRYRNDRFETIIDNINIPRSLLFDREGNLWLTSRQGIYNFFKLDCMTYKVNAQNADLVYSIVPIGPDELYFATAGGKLIHFKNDKSTEIPYPSLPDGTANGFSYRSIQINDAIYFTSFTDILRYKNNKSRWINVPADIYHVASCRLNDRKFAIGGWNKIAIMDNDGNLLRTILQSNIGQPTIYTMQADNQERLWIGGHKGICCIGATDSLYFFNENTMNAGTSDKDPTGRIWIAAESHIYFANGDSLQLFMEFPNIVIGNLCCTHNNLIVISDNAGVKIIDSTTKKVVNYDYTNGYSSGEPSWNTMTEDYDGNIWMAAQGPNVLKFNPSQFIKRFYVPTLYITSVQFSGNSINRHNIENGVRLQHNQCNLRFSFTGLCYSNPDQVRYRYRLKGFQDDWSEPVKQCEITFNNLPPGNYVFEIYADAGTDESRCETQSFAFSIKPAFWETAWFLVTCIAILMLASAGIALSVQRRKNKALLEKLHTEKELNELRISSIRLKAIPHFNANVMAAIEYYIANRTKEEAMHILGIYSDFTFKTLSDVDKAARPLTEELTYVKMYLNLEKIRFLDKFDFKIDVEEGVDENVQLPNMILHTYCENAVKHGLMPLKSGGLLNIHVSQHDSKVCVSVEDNGVGREYAAQNPQLHSSKQGLSILNRQIDIYNRFNREKINRQVNDLFKDGKPIGTVFSVEIPLDYTYIN